jgi:hypothetical protein
MRPGYGCATSGNGSPPAKGWPEELADGDIERVEVAIALQAGGA